MAYPLAIGSGFTDPRPRNPGRNYTRSACRLRATPRKRKRPTTRATPSSSFSSGSSAPSLPSAHVDAAAKSRDRDRDDDIYSAGVALNFDSDSDQDEHVNMSNYNLYKALISESTSALIFHGFGWYVMPELEKRQLSRKLYCHTRHCDNMFSCTCTASQAGSRSSECIHIAILRKRREDFLHSNPSNSPTLSSSVAHLSVDAPPVNVSTVNAAPVDASVNTLFVNTCSSNPLDASPSPLSL